VRVAAPTARSDWAFELDLALDKMAVTERLKTGAISFNPQMHHKRAEFFALPALATKNVVRNPVLSFFPYE
jgi:hypothetical protein